jgi:hypothetical protein
MAYEDDILALDLSDDVKAQLIAAHKKEIDPLKEQNQTLSAKTKKDSVEQEIAQLSELGFKEAPGLLKFVRRVLLSADAEEPGAVLLSDADLELSGDEATGARNKEEISVADTLRKVFELMPRTQEGKLNLSDQANLAENINRPDEGDDDSDEKKREKREAASSKLAGREVKRTRKRYGSTV